MNSPHFHPWPSTGLSEGPPVGRQALPLSTAHPSSEERQRAHALKKLAKDWRGSESGISKEAAFQA